MVIITRFVARSAYGAGNDKTDRERECSALCSSRVIFRPLPEALRFIGTFSSEFRPPTPHENRAPDGVKCVADADDYIVADYNSASISEVITRARGF